MTIALPKRIQLRRTRGWRKPANCVVVSRPSRWGNPYIVKHDLPHADVWDVWHHGRIVSGPCETKAEAVAEAVRLYGIHIRVQGGRNTTAVHPLRGKDLACWCPLPKPGEPDVCHAALLIEIANA